jgi:hypothetical protein
LRQRGADVPDLMQRSDHRHQHGELGIAARQQYRPELVPEGSRLAEQRRQAGNAAGEERRDLVAGEVEQPDDRRLAASRLRTGVSCAR